MKKGTTVAERRGREEAPVGRADGDDGGRTYLKTTLKADRRARASYQETSQAFAALQAGQVDAVMLDTAIVLQQAAASNGQFEVVGQFKTGEQYGAVFDKGSKILKKVNKAITALKADGTRRAARGQVRTLGGDPHEDPVPRAADRSADSEEDGSTVEPPVGGRGPRDRRRGRRAVSPAARRPGGDATPWPTAALGLSIAVTVALGCSSAPSCRARPVDSAATGSSASSACRCRWRIVALYVGRHAEDAGRRRRRTDRPTEQRARSARRIAVVAIALARAARRSASGSGPRGTASQNVGRHLLLVDTHPRDSVRTTCSRASGSTSRSSSSPRSSS